MKLLRLETSSLRLRKRSTNIILSPAALNYINSSSLARISDMPLYLEQSLFAREHY